MSDHLSLVPTEPLSGEIKRIAVDILDRASGHIQEADQDIDTAIHKVRKRMKELRAVLRTVRDELRHRNYRTENAIFRNVARTFSVARDNAVLIQSLNALIEQPKMDSIANGLSGIRARLQARYDNEIKELVQNNRLEHVAEILHAAQHRAEKWPLRENSFNTMKAGMERVYQRGLHGMLRARANPTDEGLHEWRKRVKYLWYQIRMITPAWPVVLTGFGEALHTLSDQLGDDHDLAVLVEKLRGDTALAPSYLMPDLMVSIAKQRARLKRHIWPSGVQIYAESADNFTERMETYWRASSRTVK